MDVRKTAEVKRGIAETVQRFGRLDVALNNAGLGGTGRQTHETEEEEWDMVIDVDLNGVRRCQREEIAVMLKQECVLVLNLIYWRISQLTSSQESRPSRRPRPHHQRRKYVWDRRPLRHHAPHSLRSRQTRRHGPHKRRCKLLRRRARHSHQRHMPWLCGDAVADEGDGCGWG